MSRDYLRRHFGEPLRIEIAASGGEDWYYRFVSWSNGPTSDTGATYDSGQRLSTVTAGWQITRDSNVQPIHVSSEGYVVEPIPAGKVVQK